MYDVARALGKHACFAFFQQRARAVTNLLRTCLCRPRARPRSVRVTAAYHQTTEPCRQRGGLLKSDGQNQPARRGARAWKTRLLRFLPTQNACVGRSLAHMRKPAMREAKASA